MKKVLIVLFGVLTLNSVKAQYCTPSLNCSFGDFINNFSTTGGITNITNNNSGCNGQTDSYIFYSGQTVSQIQGLSVNFTVQSGATWSQGFRIWVDWNQDGDFADPGEDVYASPNSATTAFTGTITVPVSATPGITRMRVLCRYATVPVNDPCDNSNGFGEIEDYNFDVIAAAPCVAPPTAGTTVSTQDSICPNVTFNLSLTGSTIGSGLSYQWLSGPTITGPWTPIVGATNASYAATQTTATFYRCIVTCSGQDDTSSVKLVTMRTLFGCYCTSNATFNTYGYIQNVTLNTINNTSPVSCQQYTNYTNLSTTLIIGNPYNFSTTIAGCSGGSWTHVTKVFIDYNQNGLLTDAGEEVLVLGPGPYGVFNGTFTVPVTALTGTTLMRVVTVETGTISAVQPCGTYTWGETEDYLVNIIPPPSIDINVRAMTSPVLPPNCYTNCEPVNVRLRNDGLNPIDFSIDPMTVSVNVTGVNPQLLSTTINTGTLLVGDSMLVTVDNCYDMSAFGTYNFRPYANIATDGNVFNDSLNVITINNNSSAGTASINRNSICFGDSATLTLTGNTGALQWQFSTDGGVTWFNETGTGNTSSPYIVSPSDTIMYRALVCGTLISNTITLNVNSVTNPTALTGDSRCGFGPVNLSASGTGTIKWYSDSIGGNLLHTGSTYSPQIGQTDTFWVENNLVSGGGAVGKPINFSGSGTIVLNRGLVFNTTTEIVLDSVMVYPIGSGTIQVALRNSANTIIATSPVISVTGAGLGVYIPLNFTIPVGTGYRLTLNATSGYSDLWFDNTGNTYPYNSPGGEISITNGWTGAATSTAYFYFYDWRFSRVCASSRFPVIATVTPAPAMSVSPNPAFSCQGTPVPLTISSSNSGYNYTWSPATGLSSTTGSSVIANPASTTNYTISAVDGNGCTAYDTVRVEVTPVAQIDASANRTIICGNDTTMLMSNVVGGAIQNYIIGTGTVTNTTTSYPAPYGNWYWGARHQFLITAAEMIAAGASAGPLVNMSFNVTALNTNPALQNFTIRMGHTNATNMAAWVTTPPLTTVFSAPSYQPVLGLNVHTFSTPFVWDGVSNIVIETCFNNNSFTNNVSFSQSTTSFVSSRWFFADATGVCNNTGQSGTASQRPNIRFQRLNSYSYAWSPALSVTNATTQNTIATPNGLTTNYLVTLTDSITGCTSSDSVLVTANPVPQPNLGPDINVCSGQQFVLTPGGNFNTYLWNTGSIGQLIIVNGISTPQTYWVDVTNSFGCSNRDSITVSVNPSPTINLGNDTTICKNHTLTLNAGPGFSSYLWSNGATTSSITIPQGSITSVYYVSVTNSFGCTDSDTILVTVSPCTGIEDLEGSEGTVLIYPNPNRGLFNLVVDIPGAENAQLEIINAQGRIIYNSTIKNTMAYKEVIDLSGNAAGIYYVRVVSDKFTNISKLMINN